MTERDWKPWLEFVQLVMIPGFGYGIKLLWDIREHLARLNGRVKTCEELRQAHERSDRDKHENCEERIAFIEHTLITKKG